MHDSISVARSELAPTGTLRVALNMSNFLLTATDPVTGEPGGLAADLGRELGQRLGVPVALLPYPNPGALADAAPTGVWDVGFLGAEPQRAHAIDFTAAYVEIEATYLVPPGSPLTAIAEVDRPGIRIAVPGLFLLCTVGIVALYADDIRVSRLRRHGLEAPDDPDLGRPSH